MYLRRTLRNFALFFLVKFIAKELRLGIIIEYFDSSVLVTLQKMNPLFDEAATRYLRFVPNLLWTLFLGLLEWIVPCSWYAKSVDDDIVLITGAGSGLGRALALEYAKLNSSLVLWDIDERALEDTKALVEFEQVKSSKSKASHPNAIGQRFCKTYLADVSDRVKVQQVARQVHEDLNCDRRFDEKEKYVSVLVNNAGIYHGLMLQNLRDDQIERIFKINILAHFWTVRAFLPKMIEHQKGHIVEIASMGGINGLLKQVDYCATKFATVGFEESLSIELDHMGMKDKIHTTVVCPLFFSSNLFTGYDARITPLMSSQFVAQETVMAMRCNHSRIMLPKFKAYTSYIMRCFMSRKALILSTKISGIADQIREIKGKAAQAN